MAISVRALLILLFCALLPYVMRAADSPATSGAAASGAAAESQASIPFANHGGIYDWRVVDDRTVLIQSNDRQWYKASLMSACIDLPFAQRIGFESNPDGSFDKFSAIKLHHQTCQLTSLVRTDAPAKGEEPHEAPAPPAAVPPDSSGKSP